MNAGAVRAPGLRLEAKGRNPHHFDVAFDDIDEGVARLVSCKHRTFVNPYHEA
jgi:hypothetical protein